MERSNVFGGTKKIIEDNIVVYHGSSAEVVNPIIKIGKQFKDFGFGFYVTNLEKQAVKCAVRNLNFGGNAVISKFYFSLKGDFNVKVFREIDDEWLDFIAKCRSGVGHDYDIVEGPMADDQVFNFAQMYLRGDIKRSTFLDYCKFKYPTHQICFCTERSLECLKFMKSYEVR